MNKKKYCDSLGFEIVGLKEAIKNKASKEDIEKILSNHIIELTHLVSVVELEIFKEYCHE